MLQDVGAPVTVGEFGAWVPIGAVQTASGYDVAWEIPGANEYTVWSTDSNGNYLANIIGVVPGNDYALESIEKTFNQDLNGDGVVGLTGTAIQTDTNSFGSTSLMELPTANISFLPRGTDPVLQDAGAPVTVGEFGAWVPIGAVQTANGYDVAWEIPGANEYTVWSTDSNGNYLANIIGVVPGNDYALESIETTFNQDLNGDGVVGLYAAPGTTLLISKSLAGPSGSTIDRDRRDARTPSDRLRIGDLSRSYRHPATRQCSDVQRPDFQFYRERQSFWLRSNRSKGHQLQLCAGQLCQWRSDGDRW